MNKPIRVVSVFCMLLFVALLRQRDLPDVRPRGRPHRAEQAPRQPPRASPRRSPASAARSWSGKARRAQRAVRGQVQVPAHLPAADEVRPHHRLLLLRLQPDRRGALARTPCSPADDSRLFVTRAGRPARATSDPRAATSSSPSTRPRRRRRRRACEKLGDDAQGAVVALEPTTGRVLAMASSPTFDPNKLASHDFGAVVADLSSGSTTTRREPADQPGHRHDAAARVDVQAGHRRRPRSSRATTTPTRWCRAAASSSCPQSADLGRQRRRRQLRRPQDHPDPGPAGLLQRHLPHPGQRARQRGAGRPGRGVRLRHGTSRSRTSDPAGVALPRDMDPPQTALSGIGQSSVTATPLQMAMVAAAIANDGT